MPRFSVRFVVIIAGIGAVAVLSLAILSRHDEAASSLPAGASVPAVIAMNTSSAAANTPPDVTNIPPALPLTPAPATPAVTTSAVKPVVPATNPYGVIQPVAGDANANVRSVVEAVQGSNHPERVATLIAPAPFDAQRFAANRQAYIDVIEPARVFQSAQPSADVPVLRSLGATTMTVTQEGPAVLRVKTQPLSPVTFTSFDGGKMSNQLVSQTVLADAHGVAATTFTAGPGTVGAVQVLAGSPMASGQVHFDIDVTLPKQPVAAVGK